MVTAAVPILKLLRTRGGDPQSTRPSRRRPSSSLSQKHSCWTKPFFYKIAGGDEKGAVAGLSGMTADHLQPVLDSARDTLLLFQFAAALARGQAPPCQWKEFEWQDHRVAEAPWR